MRFLKILILTLGAALILTGACDRNSPTGGGPGGTSGPFSATPRENEEAELMALWLSGEIMAPDSLYEAIDKGLKNVKGDFEETVSCSMYVFKPEFIPSELIIVFTDSLANLYRAGLYHDWDSLNNYYRVMVADTNYSLGRFTAVLRFEGRLNSYHLKFIYRKALPEMEIIDADSYAGDWPNLYPWIVDGKLAFFLRDAWGDCPAGCMNQDIYAFIQTDTGYCYCGFHSDTLMQAKPEWWGDFEAAQTRFRGYYKYIADFYK